MATVDANTTVTRSLVADEDRLSILPRYAGKQFLLLESNIYQAMSDFCPDYKGGYWTMWELSNDAFYMAPGDEETIVTLSWPDNWFKGEMSADAAGVVACLVAFSRLSHRDDCFIELFYNLREWALSHPESRQIFAAID